VSRGVVHEQRKATAMMGKKERSFAPLIHVSLEELVPSDHFYRHLEQTLDLSFVRELVQQTYAGGGRPSIDPVVFFKLQLVMFFEGLRSERQLMRHASDRLSIRWYLGVPHVTQGSIPSTGQLLDPGD
jgi:transposase